MVGPASLAEDRLDHAQVRDGCADMPTSPAIHPLESGRRRLGAAWVLTLAISVIDAAWIMLGDWKLDWMTVGTTAAICGVLLIVLAVPRYRRDLRVRASSGGAILLILSSAAGAILSYLVISTNAPLVDDALSRIDVAMGFDWMALHDAIARQPWLAATLQFAYWSGLPQMALVVLALGPLGHPERIEGFLRVSIAACLTTIVISAFVPAAGAWKHYGPIALGDLNALSHFEQLRDGTMRTISLKTMQGLITIPSLHSAMALLVVWAVRGTVLLAPLTVLNALMLASTPTFGGHYLVDVIAGVALAVAVVAADRRLSQRQARLRDDRTLAPPIATLGGLSASPGR